LYLTHDEIVAAERDKIIQRSARQKSKREVRRDAFRTMVLDTIADNIRPIDFKQPKFKQPVVSGDPEQAILQLSDWHFGKKNPSYNMEIARGRFDMVVDKVMSISSLHRKAYPVDVLHIFMIGDMVDGSSIYPTQAHHIEANAVRQVFDNVEHIAGRLCDLATFYERVDINCVRGNHGRVSKFAHENENWDIVFYLALKAATANIPNIRWDISDDWYLLVPVENTNFLLMHGDQIKMHMNIPWYGMTQRVSRLATTKQLSDFHALCTGHFHSRADIAWNDKRIIANGTAVTGDEFALEKLGLESTQMQHFYGVSAKRPRRTTWHYSLEFEE